MTDKQLGTKEAPLLYGGADRGWKWCRCDRCRTVQQCTPDFDFFTKAYAPAPALLYCLSCLGIETHTKIRLVPR